MKFLPQQAGALAHRPPPPAHQRQAGPLHKAQGTVGRRGGCRLPMGYIAYNAQRWWLALSCHATLPSWAAAQQSSLTAGGGSSHGLLPI